MSEPIQARTYGAARVLQRAIYAAVTAEEFERLAADARELARMLDRCALAAETAQRSAA